jgi:hypothetical protein
MLPASDIENALSVSLCTLPKLPVESKTDVIASSFGASAIVIISYFLNV